MNEVEYLLDATKDFTVKTLVDVGCHKAEFALPFLRRGWRVIGLEPNASDPELKEQLDKADELELFELAASNRDGIAEMFIGEHVATNSLEKKWTETAFPKNFTDCRSLTVPTVKLSTLFHSLGLSQIGILKIDTEGHDLKVVEGMLDGPVRPKIVMFEAHYKFLRDYTECFGRLSYSGYRDVIGFVHYADGSCKRISENEALAWDTDEEFFINVICKS